MNGYRMNAAQGRPGRPLGAPSLLSPHAPRTQPAKGRLRKAPHNTPAVIVTLHPCAPPDKAQTSSPQPLQAGSSINQSRNSHSTASAAASQRQGRHSSAYSPTPSAGLTLFTQKNSKLLLLLPPLRPACQSQQEAL